MTDSLEQNGSTEDQTYPVPALKLEWIDDPVKFGIKNSAGEVTEVILLCLTIASEILPQPDMVSLVLTGDFGGSVRHRLNGADYSLDRGSGFVGGKTMRNDDGSIDILLHAALAQPAFSPVENPDATLLFLHTVAHELNHAAMYQRNESRWDGDRTSWKDANLRSAAVAVIDEYRAELGALELVPEEDSGWALDDIAETLNSRLQEIVLGYQDHLDVNRLVFDVGSTFLVAWKAFSYAVAFMYGRPTAEYPIPAPTSSEWTKVAEHSWERFKEVLASIPSGRTEADPAAIADATQALVELFDQWLRNVGFEWDEPHFRISPEYMNTLAQEGYLERFGRL